VTQALAPKQLALQQLGSTLQEQQAAIKSLQLRLQQTEERLQQVQAHAEELARLLGQQQGQLADALQIEEQVQPAVEAFQQDAISWAAAAKREDAHIRTVRGPALRRSRSQQEDDTCMAHDMK
jgi:chromosome segregation ATPase